MRLPRISVQNFQGFGRPNFPGKIYPGEGIIYSRAVDAVRMARRTRPWTNRSPSIKRGGGRSARVGGDRSHQGRHQPVRVEQFEVAASDPNPPAAGATRRPFRPTPSGNIRLSVAPQIVRKADRLSIYLSRINVLSAIMAEEASAGPGCRVIPLPVLTGRRRGDPFSARSALEFFADCGEDTANSNALIPAPVVQTTIGSRGDCRRGARHVVRK